MPDFPQYTPPEIPSAAPVEISEPTPEAPIVEAPELPPPPELPEAPEPPVIEAPETPPPPELPEAPEPLVIEAPEPSPPPELPEAPEPLVIEAPEPPPPPELPEAPEPPVIEAPETPPPPELPEAPEPPVIEAPEPPPPPELPEAPEPPVIEAPEPPPPPELPEAPEPPVIEAPEPTMEATAETANKTENANEIPEPPRVEPTEEWDANADRDYRNQELRAATRKDKVGDLGEQVESGIWSEDTEALERKIGRDQLVDLAEGKIGLEDAALEVHHKEGLEALGPSAADPQNSEILTEKEHRFGAHGGDTREPVYGVHRNPDYGEDMGFGGDRQRGVPPIENVGRDLDDQAIRDWPSEEDRILENIDAARDGQKEEE